MVQHSKLVAGVVALVTVTALSGCTPAIDGGMAIHKSDRGALMGVMLVCDGSIVGAGLFHRKGERSTDSDYSTVGDWTLTPPSGQKLREWPLLDGSVAKQLHGFAPASLGPGIYSLQGGSEDVNATAGELTFHSSEATDLLAGQYLYSSPTTADANVTGSLQSFHTAVCGDR